MEKTSKMDWLRARRETAATKRKPIKPRLVTENPVTLVTGENPVTLNRAIGATRGRPKTGKAMTDAERQRRHRAKSRGA